MSNIKALTLSSSSINNPPEEQTKPTLILDIENLPVPIPVECQVLAGHRFVQVNDSQVDMNRCVDCGRLAGMASILTVAVEGVFVFEQCQGWTSGLANGTFLSITPKDK